MGKLLSSPWVSLDWGCLPGGLLAPPGCSAHPIAQSLLPCALLLQAVWGHSHDWCFHIHCFSPVIPGGQQEGGGCSHFRVGN